MKSFTEISCPSCKQKVDLFHKNTQTYGCVYCGCVSSIKEGIVSAINSNSKNPNYNPKSFIQLGQIVKFDSDEYRVIGRTVWSSDYKEYYYEDGYSGYSNEFWTYHEWILANEIGQIKYLFEDEEGYHFSNSIKPKYPNLPVTQTTSTGWLTNKVKEKIEINNFLLNFNETVTEIGHSSLQFIEGEIPWETNLGEQIFFATYDDSGERYTVETEIDEKDPNKASYFKEWKVDKKYLMNCFRANPEISQTLDKAVTNQKKYTFLGLVFILFTALSFFLFLYAENKKGTLIKEQTFIIPAAKDTNLTNLKPERVGKITNLKLPEGPVKVILSASLPKNSDLWAGVEIHDEDDLVINAIDEQFYDEEGTEYWQEDGESGYEYFHEINTSKSEIFQVEKAGNYSAEVYVAPQSATETTVYLAVYKDVLSGQYFLYLGFAGLAITAIIILNGYFTMPWRNYKIKTPF